MSDESNKQCGGCQACPNPCDQQELDEALEAAAIENARNFGEYPNPALNVEDLYQEYRPTMSDELITALEQFQSRDLNPTRSWSKDNGDGTYSGGEEQLHVVPFGAKRSDKLEAVAAVTLQLEMLCLNEKIKGSLTGATLAGMPLNNSTTKQPEYMAVAHVLVDTKTFVEIFQGEGVEL